MPKDKSGTFTEKSYVEQLSEEMLLYKLWLCEQREEARQNDDYANADRMTVKLEGFDAAFSRIEFYLNLEKIEYGASAFDPMTEKRT